MMPTSILFLPLHAHHVSFSVHTGPQAAASVDRNAASAAEHCVRLLANGLGYTRRLRGHAERSG